MATIPFVAYEISGLRNPTDLWPSAAANKKYVDDKVVAGGGVANSAFKQMSQGFGIAPFPATVMVSGSQNFAISAASWLTSTVSSNAKKGQASGTRVLDLFNHLLYTPSSVQLGKYYPSTLGKRAYASASRVTDAFVHEYYALSSAVLSKFAASTQFAPVKSWFQNSAQKLNRKSGWATTANGTATVTHGLGALPGNVSIIPSGTVSWGWVVNGITTTQFVVSITAAGSRDFGWRVGV